MWHQDPYNGRGCMRQQVAVHLRNQRDGMQVDLTAVDHLFGCAISVGAEALWSEQARGYRSARMLFELSAGSKWADEGEDVTASCGGLITADQNWRCRAQRELRGWLDAQCGGGRPALLWGSDSGGDELQREAKEQSGRQRRGKRRRRRQRRRRVLQLGVGGQRKRVQHRGWVCDGGRAAETGEASGGRDSTAARAAASASQEAGGGGGGGGGSEATPR